MGLNPQKGRKKSSGKKKRRPKTAVHKRAPGTEAELGEAILWFKAKSEFEDVQRKMFSGVLGAVVNFCLEKGRRKDVGRGTSRGIPTCALMTGVNLDHEDFFRILKEDLRREVTPHIASLRLAATGADGASLSQKAIVQITVAQLMHITCSLHSMDDGETEEEELNIKKASLILPTLAAWYSNQYPDFTSSPKMYFVLFNYWRKNIVNNMNSL